MRPVSLATCSLLLGLVAPAAANPALVTIEVRAGYGIATGGGPSGSAMRTAPLVLSAAGAWAIRDQPRTSAYAGVVVETLDRTGAGLEGGLLLTPGTRLRLRGGAKVIAVPYTLWGGTMGAGICGAVDGVRLCGDLGVDVFAAGTDLPDHHAVLQALLGFGVLIDAL